MRITELLTKETIKMNIEAKDKNGVIKELVTELYNTGIITDADKFEAAIKKRESQSTTGVGDGIAIPHAQTGEVKKPAIMFGRSEAGIDYDSLDGQDAHLFFMIAAPDGQATTHLDALAKLSGILMNPEAKERLLKADSADEVLNTIDHYDESEPSEEAAAHVDKSEDRPYIVAVTACPTGIAHTYMAADALKNKAKEMNVGIKVETNGSGGVKDPLSEADIKNASGVIVAADTKVEMDRFHGKRLLEVPVSDGIKRPEELIQSTLDEQGEIYEGSGSKSTAASSSKGRPSIYKHLMNGVSNMLPFVVAGGILIAISFFWGIESANPDHADYSPIAEMINFIGSNAFELMVPILAGFIAMSIADRPGFAPGMVGGLMAATMGSGFLGGLVAGFLAGYLMVGIKKVTENLPQALDGLKPVLIYPLLGVFLTGIIMYYIIDPPATALNETLNSFLENLSGTNIVILGAILGGMMAIDMGGPINKAAYAFSIATLTAGNPEPITAAMIGGMVPPLAIALATVVFRNKFTPVERSSGPTNLVMGLSFITEGAIPFAAADPLRVIPSMMVGSAVAGAMALGLGATIPAPHGGIFVVGVGDNVLMFLLALLVGTIVSAILLGLLKRKEQI